MPKMITALVAATLVFLASPDKAQAAPPGRCPQYEAAIGQVFPKTMVPVFSRIAYRESRCNPKSVSAVRRTGYPDVGLFQIQGSWRTVTIQLCRPTGSHITALIRLDCQLRVARYLYDHGGLGHWRASSGQ